MADKLYLFLEKGIILPAEAIVFKDYKDKCENAGKIILEKCLAAYVEIHGPLLLKFQQKMKRGYYSSLAYADRLVIAYVCYKYFNVSQSYMARVIKLERSTLSRLTQKTEDVFKFKLKDDFSQAQIKRLSFWMAFGEQVLAEIAAEEDLNSPLTD